LSGVQQRYLEILKHQVEQDRQKEQVESQLILEVVKTAKPDKAAKNLSFLVNTNLINDKARREAIAAYV
jgi:hypothetical protein